MAQVPFSPVPAVAPSGSGLPEVHSNVSAASFGGDIATAIQGFGREAAGAGDKLFERAIWLQGLNNQAEAKKADADYMVRAGQLHADYSQLEGDQAIKAYPKYSSDLKALRQSISGTLSTRDSQRQFDSDSLGTMSRGIMNAASHLASQQKAYVVQSADAELNAVRETVAQNPGDEKGFAEGLERTKRTTEDIGRLRGMPPEQIANNVRTNTSKMWASKIESTAKETPFQAVKLLEDNRGNLTEQDFKRTEAIVNNQRDAVGSANIASDLVKAHMNDEGGLTAPVAELEAKARDLAKKFSPDDPAFEMKVVRTLQSELNQRKYSQRIERIDNTQIVQAGFQSGATNMQELLSDPKVSAAFYALPPSEQNKVEKSLTNYIKARDAKDNERAMTQLTGMKNNDVESFLNVDPADPQYKLSQAQQRQIMGMQQQVKKQTAQDPRVNRAMGWMQGAYGAQMEAMGVFKRTTSNKDNYDHLTGAVQSAIDIWTEDHKKPPSNKEFLEQIAPNILKTTKEPGLFGIYGYGVFGSDRQIYNHDTSSKEFKTFVDTQKADIQAKGGSEPSDAELYKSYTRLQLLKLYPPKKKGEVAQ